MKNLSALFLTALMTMGTTLAQPQRQALPEHGGGNGGDDIELELKKKALQIGYFLKSEVGSKVFNIINADAALQTIEQTDIDVVTGNVVDKYGTIRTCVNEAERSLITCNLDRLNDLKKKNQMDILTAVLFHEILGMMGIELGYEENVSMYPISSKILPYDAIIAATPVSEANIRPEYFGLDNRSYGLTLVNKDTNESLRMICLNSNVEIHRCRNYSVVRNAGGLQAPLVNGVVSISPAELAAVKLDTIKTSQITEVEAKLVALKANGFKYLTLGGKVCGNEYRYGAGATQHIGGCDSEMYAAPAIFIFGEFDTVVEAGKQALNMGVWPIKTILNGIRIGAMKGKIKNLNKKVNLARDVLNLKNELSLVGKTKKVGDSDFNLIIELITKAISK
jgi:hypothetical protein